MSNAAHNIRMVALILLVGLPLVGIVRDGKPLARYLEFPPTTHYVQHASFAWPAFVGLALLIVLCMAPFIRRIVAHWRESVEPAARHPFPWWGWAGAGFGIAAWILAWNRFPWFAGWQAFTFSPLWIAYIVVVNALCYCRSGHCMLVDRPRHLAGLFIASAGFWWFFEYLNRFVQNWYYEGIGTLSPLQYFFFATLPFATVLPAVMGTCDVLATYPKLTIGLASFPPIAVKHPRLAAGTTLVLAGAGLACVGVWPDYLFPLLWLAPLLIITGLQTLSGQVTIFADAGRGDWRRLFQLAMAALICGVFWEMWNYYSQAKWIYTVPFVGRFKIFEMPVLGYMGYLPFGWECAVVSGLMAVRAGTVPRWRSFARVFLVLAVAALIWFPVVHLFFRPALADWREPNGIAREARALAERQVAVWLGDVSHGYPGCARDAHRGRTSTVFGKNKRGEK